MKKLTFEHSEFYGNDKRAINRHHTKKFVDEDGNGWLLDKNLSGCPPFYKIYGPIAPDYRGIVRAVCVDNEENWGDGISWKKATAIFLKTIGATLE